MHAYSSLFGNGYQFTKPLSASDSDAALGIDRLTVATHKEIDGNGSNHQHLTHFLSSCGYREYPNPEHNSGLPFLVDVFSSHDAQWVNFVWFRRGSCQKDYKKADYFFAKDGVAHRFICSFDEETHVLTEFIHSAGGRGKLDGRGKVGIIRCRIPLKFQHLVSKPQNTTALHVDLRAIENLEVEPVAVGKIRPFPSLDIRDTPKIARIPICHAIQQVNATMSIRHSTSSISTQHKLTAFTRIKSQYGQAAEPLRHDVKLPYDRLLPEWIEYHKSQGFDHFIIVDSDEMPGQLLDILQPYIRSGLVSYYWFPLQDCVNDYGWTGSTSASAQQAASMSALHRYGFSTEFFAHMDIDEFFVAFRGTILDLVQSVDYNSYDVVAFVPWTMGPCEGDRIRADQPIMAKWRCWDGGHYAAQKLIFQPARLWSFAIHYPIITVHGEKPRVYFVGKEKEVEGQRSDEILQNTTQGLLAHYRRDYDSIDFQKSDSFDGIASDYASTDRMHFMDRFVGSSKIGGVRKSSESRKMRQPRRAWHTVLSGPC